MAAKRPRDPAQLAKLMIDIASGEVTEDQPTAKEVRARKAGTKGARATLRDCPRCSRRSMEKEQLSRSVVFDSLASGYVVHKDDRRIAVAPADIPRRNEFGVGADRRPGPAIARIAGSLFRTGHVLLRLANRVQ